MGDRRIDKLSLYIGHKENFRILWFLAKSLISLTVPETVEEIADDEEDEIHTRFDHGERLLGFQFLADMINRLFFLLIVLTQIAAFCTTIVPLYVRYTFSDKEDIIDELNKLEEENWKPQKLRKLSRNTFFDYSNFVLIQVWFVRCAKFFFLVKLYTGPKGFRGLFDNISQLFHFVSQSQRIQGIGKIRSEKNPDKVSVLNFRVFQTFL